jgi:hypothetical protein
MPPARAGYNDGLNQLTRTGQSTELAKKWAGWGTALKPSFEPIILARKPLIGTVAQNVAAFGVGGLHIDACSRSAESAADRQKHAEGVKAIKERGGSMVGQLEEQL